jgi:DNA-binding response OmpR family regulator
MSGNRKSTKPVTSVLTPMTPGVRPSWEMPSTNPRAGFLLLVAESDEAQATAVQEMLTEHQITAVVCRDGAQALIAAGAEHPDAVLAAASLPELGGAALARALSARTAIPVVVGVGDDDGPAAAAALRAGATACVARPYRLRELMPILRSIRPDGVTALQPVLECGALRLDPGLLEVRLHGDVVRMPMRELRLLQMFMANAGRVVSRQQILEAVWGGQPGSNTVTVHVQRLRQRLGDDRDDPQMILAVRGVGYRLVPPPRHDDVRDDGLGGRAPERSPVSRQGARRAVPIRQPRAHQADP